MKMKWAIGMLLFVPTIVSAQSYEIPQWTTLPACQNAFSEALLVITTQNGDLKRYGDALNQCSNTVENLLVQRDQAAILNAKAQLDAKKLQAEIRRLKKQLKARGR